MWDTLGRLTTVGAGCSELNSVCRFGEGCGEMEETGTVTHERSAGSVNWRHVWCVLWSQTSFGQEKEDLKLNSVRQVTNRRRRFLRMTLNELQFMRDFSRRKCSNPVWNIRTIRILSSLFYDRNEHTTAKLQVKDDHLFHRVTGSHNSSFLILQQSLEDWSKKTKTPKAVDWLLTWPAQRHAGCSLLFQLEIICKLPIFMYLCLLIHNPWIYLYVLKCLPIIRAASLWYPPHASSFFNI